MQIKVLSSIKITLILLFLSNALFAQVKITGKVIDIETGSPINGATVSLKSNTAKGVVTDVDGIFFITAQKNTVYALVISNVGYKTKEITDIEVANDSPAPLSISLEKSSSELEGIVVKSTAKRESTAALYSVRKISSSISDGISADMIRKSPDKNTGDVLKRVSGASIQDNKFVVIRGLSERYNVSMLNNSVLPSTEADKKAFSFDIIPSSVVDNIVIYKSPTPDLPGDFAGGTVKIITKDYPTKPLSEVGLSLSYNTLTTGKAFFKSQLSGKYDAIGFLDDARQIPGPYYRHISNWINQTNDFKVAVTKMFSNSYGYAKANNSLPNASLSYTGGNTKFLKNDNKLGYIYSINYGIGREASQWERSEYDGQKRHIYTYHTNNYTEKNNLTALLNLSYSYRKSKISLKNVFNNNFSKLTGIRTGINEDVPETPLHIRGANSETDAAGILNTVLEGVHKVSPGWDVDWNGSVSYSYRNQPDQKILNFRSSDLNDGYYLTLSNQNSPSIMDAGRIYTFLNENVYGASANATKVFQWLGNSQKLKFGTMNYYRSRSVEADAVGYALLNPSGGTIKETPSSTFNNIFSNGNIDQYGIVIANIPILSTNYDGSAMLNAGYAMLDNKFTEKLKLTWGVRFERYYQELVTKGRPTKTYDNNDFLPSVLFTYSVTPKANIRLAGSQAVNRPEFRELAPYRAYDYNNNWLIQGNENLKRSKITSADLRYELFPSAGEIVSASLFYKYFVNPIEQINMANSILSYGNAQNANVYGVEIEVRKKLDFIGNDFFDRLTFYTNASYLKGSVKFDGLSINSPLQGLSPYLINGGLTYTAQNDAFSLNLLYNRIGPRLKFRAPQDGVLNIFEKPRDVLDFQISKKLLRNKLEGKLTVSDILAQPFKWYYKYDLSASNTNYKAATDKIIETNKFGTTIGLSLKYNFN
ncbi:MAG: TonB-dependent receptor [Niabella sp.]